MRTIVDAVLIAGFLAVDFFFFHDLFKAGESISLAQYLTGALSIVVIIRSLTSLPAAVVPLCSSLSNRAICC